MRGIEHHGIETGTPDLSRHLGQDRRRQGPLIAEGRHPPRRLGQSPRAQGLRSAIYLIQGRVETRYGEGLKKSVVNEAGDFIFIPPDVPHQPVNLSDTEPAIAIVARNDPEEQEHVILLPEARRRTSERSPSLHCPA